MSKQNLYPKYHWLPCNHCHTIIKHQFYFCGFLPHSADCPHCDKTSVWNEFNIEELWSLPYPQPAKVSDFAPFNSH